MKIAIVVARVLFGAVFLLSSLGFFYGMVTGNEMEIGADQPGGEFLGAMIATGYLFILIKLTELVSGLMLLAGRFVPLALTLLAPIVVNIFLFHLVLAREMLIIGIVVLVFEVFLAWAYRGSFAGVLDMNAKPSV